jgi:hypothetical protein
VYEVNKMNCDGMREIVQQFGKQVDYVGTHLMTAFYEDDLEHNSAQLSSLLPDCSHVSEITRRTNKNVHSVIFCSQMSSFFSARINFFGLVARLRGGELRRRGFIPGRA